MTDPDRDLGTVVRVYRASCDLCEWSADFPFTTFGRRDIACAQEALTAHLENTHRAQVRHVTRDTEG